MTFISSWWGAALMPTLACSTMLAAGYAIEPTQSSRDVSVVVDGRSLKMATMGEGSPTVVIEAGMGEPGLSSGLWKDIAERVSKTNRVVLYDRAGLGQSDVAKNLPRSSASVAQDLHAMLVEAKVPGPYLLVGHSMGGMHARVFCGQFPNDTAGLVLVDASHPDQDDAWLKELPNASGDAPVWASNARKFLGERSKPENNPESMDGKRSASEARQVKNLGSIPVVIVSHSPTFRMSADLPEDISLRLEAVAATLQRDFMNLSSKSSLHVSKSGGHQLHVEDPDLVVLGIREAISTITGQTLASESTNVSPALSQSIDLYLNYMQTLGKFNGSVLVASGDEVLLRKGYGLRDADAMLPNEVDTRFRVYSTTKPFTSAIVLKLAELEEISLADRVSKFVPGLASDPTLTIDHLLTHTSGLPDYANSRDVQGNDLMSLIKSLTSSPRSFPAGNGWEYSNSNYALLGHVIQKVTGEPYETVITERILTPLQMTSSGFDFESIDSSKRASAYRFIGNGSSDQAVDLKEAETFAAGGLYSTVDDLFRFSRGILAYRFLSEKTMSDAWKSAPRSLGYGRGWQVANKSGIGETIGHSGGAPGFRSDFSFSRDGRWTVIVLSNCDSVNVNRISTDVYRLLSGQEVKQPKEAMIDTSELSAYTGVYRSSKPVPMTICVSVLDDRLAVNVPGQPIETLLFTGTDFYHLERDARVTFDKRVGDKTSSMSVKQGFMALTLLRMIGGWGLLGSATPQGWEGHEDIVLKETSQPGVYTAQQVQLTDGELKFRYGNDWAVNLGASDRGDTLEQNGANISVKAGRYNVLLDLRNLQSPKCSLTLIP